MIVLLSIPALRASDVAHMPRLAALTASGGAATLTPSFPCVTWPVQANMLTGCLPREHGVVANGFYWREQQSVEMWTASNERIERPQIWDLLHQRDPAVTSAVWFPMLSKRCGADYVCMPAPVHNPDGSESLWCYTKPTELYGTLRESLGDFPLQHFWGPMANIRSTAWIVDSAIRAAGQFKPQFFYVYLPHLDYASQKFGPDSFQQMQAVQELDEQIGKLVDGFGEVYAPHELVWLAASEYAVTPVQHVLYPNRMLRDAGLLRVREEAGEEYLDFANSDAWCLVDHQFSHVFVRNQQADVIQRVRQLFANTNTHTNTDTHVAGIAEVLVGADRAKYGMDHARSGEVILISTPDSWQAYYWWQDDRRAPPFARSVDIHRKPGYDPVELFIDLPTKSIPLDATLVRGSHGAPATSPAQKGVLLTSQAGLLTRTEFVDTDIAALVLEWIGRGAV